jgi:hypothetical protein
MKEWEEWVEVDLEDFSEDSIPVISGIFFLSFSVVESEGEDANVLISVKISRSA